MNRLLRLLAQPLLFFYAVPWLMVLLVLGTIIQRDAGLYVAQQRYFAAPILWLDCGFAAFPLPGGSLTLAFIACNLIAKLCLQRQWRKKLGTSLTHISMIVLLVGGAFSAWSRQEGFMELAPAATSNQVEDYHQREFVVERGDVVIKRVDFTALRIGQTMTDGALAITITALCRHCKIVPTQHSADSRGVAAKHSLIEQPLLPQEEANLAGVEFTIQDEATNQTVRHLAFAPLLAQPDFTLADGRYRVFIQKVRRTLPFTVRLMNFFQDKHPATNVARTYRSDVMVQDGAASWPATITMNQPLRYRGYTLYQAAVSEQQQGEQIITNSVLNVVRDDGQIFPYVAITLACAGMILHLIHGWRRGKRQPP